jgi:hypothetical protein
VQGWVYVLTNPSMPGLVKVGMTRGTPEARARDLSRSTGVPRPFAVVASARVGDPEAVEAAVHSALARRRVNTRREFFRVGKSEARRALRRASGQGLAREAALRWMLVLALSAAVLVVS